MKIAITSDEIYPVHSAVIKWLKKHDHEPVYFGALKSNHDESWVKAAQDASMAIQHGECDEGIFFCWTGTGISIAANKCAGIRAALCTDAETARGARIWNHANVLALSNRLLSQDIAKEILAAWFEDYDKAKGAGGLKELQSLERN
jgi:ribose 5-phosphate isomerase B